MAAEGAYHVRVAALVGNGRARIRALETGLLFVRHSSHGRLQPQQARLGGEGVEGGMGCQRRVC